MITNNSLVFRIKLTKEEVQHHLIQVLKAENLINGNEEKYFTEMTMQGKHFKIEFVVPLKEVDNNKNNV